MEETQFEGFQKRRALTLIPLIRCSAKLHILKHIRLIENVGIGARGAGLSSLPRSRKYPDYPSCIEPDWHRSRRAILLAAGTVP